MTIHTIANHKVKRGGCAEGQKRGGENYWKLREH